MKLDDIDFEVTMGKHRFRISQMTIADIDQIRTIAEAILQSEILECEIKALLCAFQLYIESLVETEDYRQAGGEAH